MGSIPASRHLTGAHMPTHHNTVRVLPGTHLYTWVESSNVDKVSCWRTKVPGDSGNRTRALSVRVERPHHYTTASPQTWQEFVQFLLACISKVEGRDKAYWIFYILTVLWQFMKEHALMRLYFEVCHYFLACLPVYAVILCMSEKDSGKSQNIKLNHSPNWSVNHSINPSIVQ